MTERQFEILCDPQVVQAVEENLSADPVAVAADKALARRLSHLGRDAVAAVATQVKYLQRARVKMPRWYEARCIIPPLSFEQAGSAECAAHKRWTGDVCIDLTCGLGVDAANFAAHFGRVIAVERDPLLAAVARHNFALMGIRNVEVVNTSAEDFLHDYTGTADLIYADPDRRGEANRKLVLLQDCAPDVVALHERMHRIAPRVVFKLSPLFDPAEGFRIFGPHTRIEAVSLSGECKELLIETGEHIASPVAAASIACGQTMEMPYVSSPSPGGIFEPPYRYLLLPDVSLRRMRMTRTAFPDAYMASDTGYAFCNALPGGDMYRAYEIEEIHPYNPRALARLLRERDIRSVRIMQRDFPLSNAEIARRLGVREGGQATIAFTVAAGKQLAVIVSEK